MLRIILETAIEVTAILILFCVLFSLYLSYDMGDNYTIDDEGFKGRRLNWFEKLIDGYLKIKRM